MTARWDRIAASLDVEGLAIALGASSIVGDVSKFGANFDLDVAELPTSLSSVQVNGGVYAYPTTDESLEVLSANAADADAGTGMREITIEGLDTDWNEQSQTVTLNGLTAVAIPGTWRRVHRAFGEKAGSGKTNAGEITIRVASAGATRLNIPAGFGQTVHGIYTVPAGHTAYVKVWYAVHLPKPAAEAVNAHVALFTRENDDPDRPFRARQTGSTGLPNPFVVPQPVPEKTDIELRVLTVDANNTQIAGTFQLVLVKMEDA